MTILRPIMPDVCRIEGQDPSLSIWNYAGAESPVLFCHCTGVCARIWDPVITRLQLKNRIIAPDARGHGDSEKPQFPRAYSWREFSCDILNIVDAMGLPKGVWAVGHSGGAAALAYAELMRPGCFSRLVLIDPIIAPSEFFITASRLAHLTRRRKAVFTSRDEARLRLGSKAPMNTWHQEALDAYIAHGLADTPDGCVSLKCPPEIEAWVYECGGMIDLYDRLGEMHAETLLITGEDSYMVEYVHLQHSRLQWASLINIPQTGHFIPQEKPERVATLISDWFGG